MSYSFYIGEAVLETVEIDEDEEEVVEETTVEVTVHELSLPEAPCFPGDEMTGHTNGRHPGYGAWDEFCRLSGLHEAFYGPGGRGGVLEKRCLIQEHPGSVRLLPSDLKKIRAAKKEWEAKPWKASKRVPGWLPAPWARKKMTKSQLAELEPEEHYDGILARLIWLEWWVAWALKNCKMPTFHNY